MFLSKEGLLIMEVTEFKRCMFCGSTDGAYNEVCNYHYMIFQNDEEFNDYVEKFNELQEAKQKLLELAKK